MDSQTGLLVATTCVAASVVYYAWNWAFGMSAKLAPPLKVADAVTGLHHTRDSVYLLLDTPRTLGNNMGFTQEQVETIFKTSLQLRGSDVNPNDLSLLMNFVGSHESKGLSYITEQVPQELTSRKIHDLLTFYRGDCAFSDLIAQLNKEVVLNAHTETVCTFIGLSACVFICFNPGTFLNIMGFGADSFIHKLSWNNFGSLTQIMKPSSLGAISSLFLTGTATYGSASALSQGLVRPVQAIDAYNNGVSLYRYRAGCVTPGSSGVMEGPRKNYNPGDFCVGERSALCQQTKLYLKSKSFVTPASLAIGSVLGLKSISAMLN
jgi:hypothetical protein